MGELPQIRIRCEQLQEKCEMCFVNSSQDQPKSSIASLPEHCTESASDLSKMITDEELINKMAPNSNPMRRTQSLINMAEDSITEALEKKDRCDYFYNVFFLDFDFNFIILSFYFLFFIFVFYFYLG